MSVGERLKRARKCRGYTRKLVSKYVRIPVLTLEAYENSDCSVPLTRLKYLAKAYDVPLKWLAHGGDLELERFRVKQEQRLTLGLRVGEDAELRLQRWLRDGVRSWQQR
jgi:transcriptional regulator with XRE-family HTH domain